MNLAKKNTTTISDPISVLRLIESGESQTDLRHPMRMHTALLPSTRPAADASVLETASLNEESFNVEASIHTPAGVDENDAIGGAAPSVEPKGVAALAIDATQSQPALLKLHIDPQVEISDSEYRFDVPPTTSATTPITQQSKQLVEHLRSQQKDLTQREADLQSRTYEFDRLVLATESALRKKNAELKQQLSQVQRQQEQLVKLQNSLVNCQTAIGRVVERLVDECDATDIKFQLEILKTELNDRFESNFRNWERLFQVAKSA